MLATRDVPGAVEERYTAAKALATQLFAEDLHHCATTLRIPAQTNLLTAGEAGQIWYIVAGHFHLYQDGRSIRLYSDGDFVFLGEGFAEFTLISEFASDVAYLAPDDLYAYLAQHPSALAQWLRLQALEQGILLGLMAAHLEVEPCDDFAFKPFAPGEVIIREGEEATTIYELITGCAEVQHTEQVVGQIQAGELFGEMSFFTESPRFASVIAVTPCLTRVVRREDFGRLLQTNHNLALSVARTLAKRIADLNEQLSHTGT